ncbi:MAG: hypothetical protein U0228_03775 [Myxococcaceae bacterium]
MSFLPWRPPTLLPLIDRPARDALTRAQLGPVAVLGPALLGLTLMVISTTVGLALAGATQQLEPTLRALLEAVLLATPVFVALTTLTVHRLTPDTTLAGLAVSLAIGGMSAMLVLPLLAFLHLCTLENADSAPISLLARTVMQLMAPATFLLGVSVGLSRFVGAFAPRAGRNLAWLFALSSFAVLLLHVSPSPGAHP